MKKLIATGIAAAAMALSINATASPFNYVEYAIGNVEFDGGGDGDYSALSASFETSVVPIVSLEMLDYNDFDVLKLGIGGYMEIGSSAHLFGLVHYNDYDNIDSDFSLTAGIRSTISDRLEVTASYTTYTDVDSLDGIALSLGYYFTENFSVAGHYEMLENSDVMAVSARLSF
ncbi:hypothetical protein [Marinomonas colpomeniae]|uniref:Outer membrane protein beta-barrel domain-containing protein n=1 Tax=Marinomonas colpomeniae TaxID=2774408 RepID=A0ABR8NZM2_9GAMM|nr:hypothetical protein [Marinomonas colpomeniae]MBD5771495.1 hypothetical protein [Marinomonas colpomeniae]